MDGIPLERSSARPRTVVEKVFARVSGSTDVRPGDVVWARPDLVVTHDLSYERHRRLVASLGFPDIAAPEKVFATIDHTTHSEAPTHLATHAFMRTDAREQGIGWFLDSGRQGISHNAPLELGLVRPGMLVISADTRAPALGCVGAIGVALGLGVATAYAIDRVWLRVPQTIRVDLRGAPRAGVMSRDIGQWIAAAIGSARGDYRCIEFVGDYVEALDEDGRHTLCNAMVDIGVKAAVCPDPACASDAGATFVESLAFDVGSIGLQVCLPPDPQNVAPIERVAGTSITSAFIGSCIGGKMEDLRAAASVLRDRRVHDRVRLTVISATQDIHRRAIDEGLIDIFVRAGADVAAGICGPCYGTYAPLGPGDVSICTATRNDHGRLGSISASVYLANAAVVAASSVAGCIASPAALDAAAEVA